MDTPIGTHDPTAAYIQRIFVGIFVPALLGAFLYFSLMTSVAVFDGRFKAGDLWMLPAQYIAGAVYAFAFVGAQSIAYAVIMEHVVNRRLQSDRAVITTSALLGAISATAMLPLFPWRDLWFSGVVITIGVIVGLVVGRSLRHMYKKAANSAAQSDAFRPAPTAPTHSAPGRGR